MTKTEALKTYYGYDAFREGQEPIIDALLSGQDAMAIMPTGAGKSVCYQIPALLLPGITLVISPLVSLMRDQVLQLVQMGVPAAYLNSSLSYRQYLLALERAKAGRYKIIYVAPERLETEGFQAFVQQAEISMIAVDEAHCISQWGQDFRPSYLNIPAFVETLPKRPVLGAFTATATQEVKRDIEQLLKLQTPHRVTTGFDRQNLIFEVRHPESKKAELLQLLRACGEESAIVYCSTRKHVEDVCELLRERGITAGRYHAGLEAEERQQNQEDFLYDRVRVMVATNAFGMGIDKPNVRRVIHYNMPKDMESYYQEAGRAGRDGLQSRCILLYNYGDVKTCEFLIEHSEPREELASEAAARLKERDYQRLKQMVGYCKTHRCLRQYILEYFGETAPDYCGSCYNCLHNFEEVEISRDARFIAACIEETGQRFGVNLIAETLSGELSDKVLQYRLDRTDYFGALRDLTSREVRERIRFLLDEEILTLSVGKYPVLQLTSGADEVISGGGELVMNVMKTRKATAVKQATVPNREQEKLFLRLRELCGSLARRQGIPSYAIFTDKTLREMAAVQPVDMTALGRISGVGEAKARRYGGEFLEEIRRFRASFE